MKVVFHGANASTFHPGFAELLDTAHELVLLPDHLGSEADREAYATADVIIGIRFDDSFPTPRNLKLYQEFRTCRWMPIFAIVSGMRSRLRNMRCVRCCRVMFRLRMPMRVCAKGTGNTGRVAHVA